MTNSLEERLKTHSSAFNGLLSLIPAKFYYDDATQDQWQQKKKGSKEANRNRVAKLDPEAASSADSYNTNGASAKDVMDNKAKVAENTITSNNTSKKKETGKDVPTSMPDSEGSLHLNSKPHMEFDDEGDEVEVQKVTKQGKKSLKKPLTDEEKELLQKRRAELKEKLAEKINLLREKRKAPGSKAGGPAKSREQMLTERKRKEEIKRQEKLKRKREEDENEAADDDSDKSDDDENDGDSNHDEVLFGNIEFQDGTRMTSDLKAVRNGHKRKKGPSNNDIKAHLAKLETTKMKLQNLSPEERKKMEEKYKWKNLMDQAEGVKVKDDEKLLKKALKRKEKQKLKSEIEWRERKQVVKDTISARQKRREANLKARRENKGKKGKNQVRLKKFTGVVNKNNRAKDTKKRAGFEGNAKSKGKTKK